MSAASRDCRRPGTTMFRSPPVAKKRHGSQSKSGAATIAAIHPRKDEATVAVRNAEVMELVAQELERDPGISVEALFDRAKTLDPQIGELSLRQFHARYPLPIKRRKSQGKGKRARKPRKSGSTSRAATPAATPGKARKGARAADVTPRDAVRRVFLDFAGDLARAESRASIVEVIARVDEYVDRALASSAGPKR
jgi:hypothetical protein